MELAVSVPVSVLVVLNGHFPLNSSLMVESSMQRRFLHDTTKRGLANHGDEPCKHGDAFQKFYLDGGDYETFTIRSTLDMSENLQVMSQTVQF